MQRIVGRFVLGKRFGDGGEETLTAAEWRVGVRCSEKVVKA